MPDPNRLLSTLHRAAQAFRQTPGRRGRVIYLEQAAEVLVVGDLHGHLENFKLALTRANLAQHPARHLVLQEVVHGPFRYPAGGDKSHQLLDLVAALKCQFPRQVHFLLGNHELSQWLDQHIAKGDVDFNELFREGVATAYGSRAEEVYTAYQDLFAAAPLVVRTPNRVYVSHSLPGARRQDTFDPHRLEREDYRAEDVHLGGTIHALVWGRDTAAATAAAFLAKVDADWLISGHIHCETGYQVPNDRQIILDAAGCPACYCLFPADRPLTQAELIDCIGTLE
jgi:hypothetical protein